MAVAADVVTEPATFTCPVCLMTSHHPDDAAHGYCGACRAFTGRRCRHCGRYRLMPHGPVQQPAGRLRFPWRRWRCSGCFSEFDTPEPDGKVRLVKHHHGYMTPDGRWLVSDHGYVDRTVLWTVVDTWGRLEGGADVLGLPAVRTLIAEQEATERKPE